MKARLLYWQEAYHLLLCNGDIQIISSLQACDFLLNYDDPQYYSGDGTWDYEDLTMESYRGTTIAYVSDDGILHIIDPEQYRTIMLHKDTKFLSVKEYAELHGKQGSIIRRHLRDGRLPGAFYKGNSWLIPENTPYPPDIRTAGNHNFDEKEK